MGKHVCICKCNTEVHVWKADNGRIDRVGLRVKGAWSYASNAKFAINLYPG